MKNNRENAGFTLIELMIVVAIIAIIASIAIPKLMAARLSANEAAAISTLRSISSAQALIRNSGSIDCDADGLGEYGYFAELAGTKPMRVSLAGVPAAGAPAIDLLTPAVLSSSFGTMTASRVTRSGYMFQMWLPNAAGNGVAEDALGGKAAVPFPDPNNNENMWCCYAWPLQAAQTGNRTFFMNEQGDLLQWLNRSATPYNGAAKTPGYGEVYNVATNMGSGLRVGVSGGADATTWRPTD